MIRMMAGSVLAVVITAAAAQATDVIALEDFDGGALNLSGTTNVFDYGAGGGTGGDAFGRVVPFVTGGPYDLLDDSVAGVSGSPFAGDSRGVLGQYSTAAFGMVDSDGNIDGNGNPLNDAVWSFDVSSATSLTEITIDIGAMGDFEESSTDGFLVEAQIDGGGYQEIFKGRTYLDSDELFRMYRPMDDGSAYEEKDALELSIDGVATGTLLDKCDPATGLLDIYTSVLFNGQSGSALDVRISWAGSPSGSEAMAFDNITIYGETSAQAVLLGDANNDGVVSADDFAAVQTNFGNVGAADGLLPGDANDDGVVSADDFAAIQTNFGNVLGGGGGVASTSVPEPATMALLAIGGLAATLRGRGRGR